VSTGGQVLIGIVMAIIDVDTFDARRGEMGKKKGKKKKITFKELWTEFGS
jgi:hypothetical protein